MQKGIRKIPLVCLCIAIARLLTGRLKLSKEHVGTEFMDKHRSVFRIFRNILTEPSGSSPETIVFVVSFRFARLSHKANKVASLIPMLLIAGFPGFVQKMYAVTIENGYWQGIYEWKSKQHLEAYKNSFVFRMMKKRAYNNSIQMKEYQSTTLKDYISTNKH
jgi:hypothetical protein